MSFSKMFELKNKTVKDKITSAVITKSQMDRSKVTTGFLYNNKAPHKFRESINDAYRSRVLDKTLGSYPDNKYVPEAFRVKNEMKHVLSHGETGHWCTAMGDVRVYSLIEGEINCASVIRKLHELWIGMDKDEIKKILEIDFLSKFGDSHNVILGDKVDSSDEFVNVMTHIMYEKDFMRDDFRKALESSRHPDSRPNIVINKRFKKDTSLLEACDVITNSQEWMHPDVKSFSRDGEFCMFFNEYNRVAIKDFISHGLLLKNIPVKDTPGSVVQRNVRGSGCGNVVEFPAYPSSRSMSSDAATKKIQYVQYFRCRVCRRGMTFFIETKNEHKTFLEMLNSVLCNVWAKSNSLVCKRCIRTSNTVEMKNEVSCKLCNKKKSSFLTCCFKVIHRENNKIIGEGLCTECIDKAEFTTMPEFLYKYSKRSNACMGIQKVGRKYVAKRSLDDLRCEPENLFDPEFSEARKKIVKIDSSRFG